MEPVVVRGCLIPADELVWRFSRSSGPGGQGVNTSDSRVELSFDLANSPSLDPVLRQRALRALGHRLRNGVLTVSASRERSQLRNRELALQGLASLLRTATAPPAPRRVATKPSRAATQRRLDAKRARSRVKASRGRPAATD